MRVFNSLGSNYDFKFVLNSLFALSEDRQVLQLKQTLEEKYNGEAVLFYKGRQAITFALDSLNLPKNSLVAFTGFTCYAVYKAIEDAGLRPVPIDINESLNFSANELNKTIKNFDVKVLIIQNTLGYPCNIDEILKICKEKNIILIEDLAHCVGTVYENGKEAGTIGDFTVLSFSQDKIIDGISGGALIVRRPRRLNAQNLRGWKNKNPSIGKQLTNRIYPFLTLLIRSTYDFGFGKLLHFILKKTKLLSSPMQESFYKETSLPSWYASLINYQFENLNKELKHRREIANLYKKKLSNKIVNNEITDLVDLSTNLRFPIFTKNRKDLIEYLKKNNVYASDIWYDFPIAPKKYLGELNFETSLPNSKRISQEILNLPTHKNVSEKQAIYLFGLINKWGGRA